MILDDDESRHVCIARASSSQETAGTLPASDPRKKSTLRPLRDPALPARDVATLARVSDPSTREGSSSRVRRRRGYSRRRGVFVRSPSKNRPGLRPPRPEDRLGANRDVTSASRADRDGQVPARQAPREGVLRRGDARDPGDGPEQEIRRGACVARPAPRSGERPRGPGSAFHDGQGRGAVEKVNANRSRAIGTRPRRPRTRRHPRFAFRFVERLD